MMTAQLGGLAQAVRVALIALVMLSPAVLAGAVADPVEPPWTALGQAHVHPRLGLIALVEPEASQEVAAPPWLLLEAEGPQHSQGHAMAKAAKAPRAGLVALQIKKSGQAPSKDGQTIFDILAAANARDRAKVDAPGKAVVGAAPVVAQEPSIPWMLKQEPGQNISKQEEKSIMDKINSYGRELCEGRPDHPSCKVFEEHPAFAAPAPAAATLPPAAPATVAAAPAEPLEHPVFNRWGHIHTTPAPQVGWKGAAANSLFMPFERWGSKDEAAPQLPCCHPDLGSSGSILASSDDDGGGWMTWADNNKVLTIAIVLVLGVLLVGCIIALPLLVSSSRPPS